MHRDDWAYLPLYTMKAAETHRRMNDLIGPNGDFFYSDRDEDAAYVPYELQPVHRAYDLADRIAQYFAADVLGRVAGMHMYADQSGTQFYYIQPWCTKHSVGVDVLSALLYYSDLLPGSEYFYVEREEIEWLESFREKTSPEYKDTWTDYRDPRVQILFGDYSASEAQERIWSVDAAKLLRGKYPFTNLGTLDTADQVWIDQCAADLQTLTQPFDLHAPGVGSYLTLCMVAKRQAEQAEWELKREQLFLDRAALSQ